MKTIFITQKIVKDKYGLLILLLRTIGMIFLRQKINLVPVNKVENMINFKYSDVSGIIIHGVMTCRQKKETLKIV